MNAFATLDDMLTVAQAADLLQVTPRQVQLLVEKGYIRRAGRGQYSLVAVVQGYIRYLLFEKYGHSTYGEIAEARRYFFEAEINERVEQRLRQLARERSRG